MSDLVATARSWVGRHFNPGQREQCAAFVRAMFHEAGVPVGVATRPSDWRQTQGLPQGPAFANSFAGDDVGAKVKMVDLRPGDVVLWDNTYGDYAPGTLTHVGIYVGGGEFVHRPTVARPVELASLSGWWADRFAEGRRVPGAGATGEGDLERLKVSSHGGKTRVFQGGREVAATTVKLYVHDGQLGLSLNGQGVKPASVTLDIAYQK